MSRDPKYILDQSLITHRLNIALSLREKLFDKPYYRLAFGDSDGLPRLIVDRYGDVLVAQITTAGMERLKTEIVAALEKVVKPRAILWRNDSPSRELEGLNRYVEPALGEVPEMTLVEENGAKFEAPLTTGQEDRLVLRPAHEPRAAAALRPRRAGARCLQLSRRLRRAGGACRRGIGHLRGQLAEIARMDKPQRRAQRRGRQG